MPLTLITDPEEEEEVLFLTSNTRLFEAYFKWHRAANRNLPIRETKALAAESIRGLMRYLAIPSVQEIQYYRQEELPG